MDELRVHGAVSPGRWCGLRGRWLGGPEASEDAAGGAGGDVPAGARELERGSCLAKPAAAEESDGRAHGVGEAPDGRRGLEGRADGAGVRIGRALPVGDGVGADEEDARGDLARPGEEASDLEGSEALGWGVVRCGLHLGHREPPDPRRDRPCREPHDHRARLRRRRQSRPDHHDEAGPGDRGHGVPGRHVRRPQPRGGRGRRERRRAEAEDALHPQQRRADRPHGPLVAAPTLTSVDWQSRFYHAEYIGSVRRLTNEDGAITDGYTYSAFGELLAHTGTDPQPYAFTGEPLDPNSGWQYHRARWMDPRVERFASADPWRGEAFDPPTLHQYLNAANDPARRADPSGLMTLVAFTAVAAIIRVIAGSLRTEHCTAP